MKATNDKDKYVVRVIDRLGRIVSEHWNVPVEDLDAVMAEYRRLYLASAGYKVYCA